MLRMMLWVAAFEMAAGGGCSRTPEPTSSAPAPAVTSPVASPSVAAGAREAGALAGRCIRQTLDTLPPAVSAVSESECPKDPEHAGPLRTADVAIAASAREVHVEAELALSPSEDERGLMYRREMAASHGMFFSLGSHSDHVFWMHNTCIPLDMLFVDDDGLIVGILENVPPMNDTQRSVGCPSSYVLETNAGFCRKNGVKAGQKMKLPRL